jgi:hypothetical protein
MSKVLSTISDIKNVKVETILKGSLNLIPSFIKVGGKVCLRCKGGRCEQKFENNKFEGDGIKSRLSS